MGNAREMVMVNLSGEGDFNRKVVVGKGGLVNRRGSRII